MTADHHAQNHAIPYWNVNVNKADWTAECPPFLLNVDDSDRIHLSIPDDQYHRMSWADVKEVIRNSCPMSCHPHQSAYKTTGTNDLAKFKRLPSDLRRYRAFIASIKESHGSVMNFIMKERVKWEDITPRATPFQNTSNYYIVLRSSSV